MLSVTDVRQFYLGVQGENEEQTITVDVKPWLASYPNGVVSIWHKRNGESVPTPTGAVFDAEEGTITWIPTYTDTYNAGEGEAEIRLYENGVIKKTRTVKTGVAPSVTGAAGVTLESGWQGMINYIDDVVEDAVAAADDAGDAAQEAEDAQGAAEAAQTAAESAQTAAESAMMHYPYVDPTTGNWMLWDPETGAYVNTGIHAQGPTGTVPDIQVGTVTTLLPDQPATVTRRSGSPDEEPIFDFGIPKGDTGQAENIYGNTIDMSALDSTKVSAAIGAKTDKVREATSGNFAGLDANGNLTDSGHKHSDYLTQHQDISGKQDKTDNSLDTTAKTVVGAINEHESDITSINSNKADVKALNLTNTISASSTADLKTALLSFVTNSVNSDGVATVVLKLTSGVTAPLYSGGWGATIQKASNNYFSLVCSNNYYPPVLIRYNNGDWFIDTLALKSDIKTDSFTGTTSASGNVSKAHSGRVIVLSAWTDGSDRIVTPFPGAGAGITGQYTWWFQVFSDNSSHSVIANTSVTIYYVYIQME